MRIKRGHQALVDAVQSVGFLERLFCVFQQVRVLNGNCGLCTKLAEQFQVVGGKGIRLAALNTDRPELLLAAADRGYQQGSIGGVHAKPYEAWVGTDIRDVDRFAAKNDLPGHTFADANASLSDNCF